jgi:hypothetical protein
MVRLETLFRTLLDAPDRGISLRSKLVLKIFDGYANILKACTVRDSMVTRKIKAIMTRWTPSRSGRTLTPPHHLSPTLSAKQYPAPKGEGEEGSWQVSTHFITYTY